ncbi:hypothetical protein FBR05_02135 [Deltaproteobacteria bacterium PRO3]|nr:hypothetical protein [Deltaproteobacteria bacterium PRO3]
MFFGGKKGQWWGWLWAALLAGCSGSATVPAPLAEIPAVISIPNDLSIDVSEANSSPSGIRFVSGKALVGPGPLSNVIPIGPDLARTITEDVLQGLLSPFNTFEIPVSPQTRNFTGTLPASDTLPQVFKFDFSDYDFDGDGVNDGFTGCTCPVGCNLQVCPEEAPLEDLRRVGFRIWIQNDPAGNFEKIMAGFFERLPVKDDPLTPENEENPGKGRFRVNVFEASESALERLLIGVIYDHKDPDSPSNQSTQAFLWRDLTRDDGTILLSNQINTEIRQLGRNDPAGTAYLEKSVKSTFNGFEDAEFTGGEDSVVSERYIGRFRDDADFWSGSYLLDEETMDVEVPTTCARISTASEVPSEICEQDLLIDTSQEAFLRSTLLSDVLFPADFPLLPPPF